MPPHKIVFLNAPPGSGKDTAGRELMRRHDWIRLYEMKQPMDRALRMFFDYDSPSWMQWEHNKDTPISELDHLPFDSPVSLRQIKIAFSEQFAKPVFGPSIFGNLAVMRLYHTITLSKCTVITDSGFVEESEPIINAFHPRNCLCIHIHRPGHTFDNDSRSYWTYEGVRTMVIHNNTDEELFIDLIDHAVTKWMTGT